MLIDMASKDTPEVIHRFQRTLLLFCNISFVVFFSLMITAVFKLFVGSLRDVWVVVVDILCFVVISDIPHLGHLLQSESMRRDVLDLICGIFTVFWDFLSRCI